MITWLSKFSKTTWVGFLLPLFIVIIRIPSGEIIFKIFGNTQDFPVFMSPLFFPSPTLEINGLDYHDIGNMISSLVVLVGFMVFVGGMLHRFPSLETKKYLKRWALGTIIYLGYLALFEIPAFVYSGGNPDFAFAWFFTVAVSYLLILTVSIVEGSIFFVLWRRKRKKLT